MNASPERGIRGFTLVEIVLALGLIAFALVGVFGLLSAAANSSKNSDQDTLLVSMTSQVMNDLRGVPFFALWEEEPNKVPMSKTAAQPRVGKNKVTALKDSTFYFTGEGVLMPKSQILSAPVPLGAVYRCTVKKTVDPKAAGFLGMKSADVITDEADDNLIRLQLLFEWPANVKKPAQNQVIYAKIANY